MYLTNFAKNMLEKAKKAAFERLVRFSCLPLQALGEDHIIDKNSENNSN